MNMTACTLEERSWPALQTLGTPGVNGRKTNTLTASLIIQYNAVLGKLCESFALLSMVVVRGKDMRYAF